MIKEYVFIFLIFSMLYYVFESIFNRLTIGNIVEKKLKKNSKTLFGYASIWMILFGGIVGIVLRTFLFFKCFNIFIFAIFGMIVITGLELLGGIILEKLNIKIWDYSNSKIFGRTANYKGHIDVYHSMAWYALSLLIYWILNFFIFLKN